MIRVVLAEDAETLRPLLDDRASLSHTDGLAAVALCDDAVVGVDVERVRDVRGMASIAERMCGERIEDRDAFFAAWTLAEARAKALRTGFAGSTIASRAAVWGVGLTGLPDGYAGAVACADGPRGVVLRPR